MVQSGLFTKDDILNQLDAGRFMLLRQPVIDLHQIDDVNGYTEICTRWVNEERDQTPTGTFITILEESWLMSLVDKWIVHSVGQLAHEELRLPWKPHKPRKYAISLSNQSVMDADIADYLGWVIEKQGVGGKQFVFQISFDVAIDNAFRMVQICRNLVALGCEISLVGTPTLEQLLWARKNLHLKYIKLDVSGCRNESTRYELETLFTPIIASCKALNIKLIAQFVDHSNTFAWLKRIGFSFAQGYDLAMPSVVHPRFTHSFIDEKPKIHPPKLAFQ